MDILDNDVAGNHLFTYFKQYPKQDMVNLRKIPVTKMKQEMLDNCKSSVERFIDEMDNELDSGLLYDWVGKEGEKAISCPHFYEIYKTWCSQNGEKGWSNKAVGSELKAKELYKYQDKSQLNKIQRKYYVF
jgi:phage/plasmid-associated DNA primase